MTNKCMKLTWWKPEQKLPPKEETVLAIISGRFGGVTLYHSLELATFYEDEGWLIDSCPRFQNPIIDYWARVPLPDEIIKENMRCDHGI